MKNQIKIPSRRYFKKVKQILFKEILLKNKGCEFNNLRRSIYSNEKILKLMAQNNIKVNEISSGVSDRTAYKGYLKQIISDFKKNKYYKNYYPSKGNLEARNALNIYENYKLNGSVSYSPDDFCLTEGSTGAITMIFEYIKKYYPNKEILIQSPNYYLYKFAADYYDLKLKEVAPPINANNPSFIPVDTIIKNITNTTKLIIITNPANPSGEIFSEKDLKKILLIAKEKNILVLVDELFAELVFEPDKYVYSDTIASSLNAMNNLVIVKGYSKSKNLVGLRIGYLYSKNKELTEAVALISQQRSSYSVASNFTGLIALDCFIQSVRYNSVSKIKRVIKDFQIIPTIKEKSYFELVKECQSYSKYFESLIKFYSERFDEAINILNVDAEIKFPKKSAFNTIVKIKDLDNVNNFDFMLNCFLTTGLKTEIGPCFGFNQKRWDNNLGFWLRLTFAKDKKLFKEGIIKFIEFKKIYLKNPNLFIKTNLSF